MNFNFTNWLTKKEQSHNLICGSNCTGKTHLNNQIQMIKAKEKIAIHQGFGYISIGKFVGVDLTVGTGYCLIIKVKPKDDEWRKIGGYVELPIDDFNHGGSVFRMSKPGYEDWLEGIKKEVTNNLLYHKWNTNPDQRLILRRNRNSQTI